MIEYKGSCLCGEIKYVVKTKQTKYYLCHCKKCQKSFSNLFATFFQVKVDQFNLLKGELKKYNSSSEVERSFCPNCGTHIHYRLIDSNKLDLALGSLDDLGGVEPAAHVNIQSKIVNFDSIITLPKFVN